jgi:hypothetical protein
VSAATVDQGSAVKVRWLRGVLGRESRSPAARGSLGHPIEEAIGRIEQRWQLPPGPLDERPVFILASSWRSGSTLLQRLVVSSGKALVWGEPWAHLDLVRRLAHSLVAVTPDHPSDKTFIAGRPALAGGRLHEDWIANLSPEPDALAAAHRRFFLELLAEPARRRGFDVWGLKEVRLGADEAAYLRWLFPSAVLLFLVRNPYHAWRSYRAVRTPWFDRWPDARVDTPADFGRRWRERTQSFLDRREPLGAVWVAYEELCAGRLTQELAARLELPLRADTLALRLRGSFPEPEPLPARELRELREAVEPLAAALGYGA